MENNISHSFVSRLAKKKLAQENRYLADLAKSLPIEYIDSGRTDNRFTKAYRTGAGSDEDEFGRKFAFYAVSYAIKKLYELENHKESVIENKDYDRDNKIQGKKISFLSMKDMGADTAQFATQVFDEQLKVLNHLVIATHPLAPHIFRSCYQFLKARISDSILGLSSYPQLASRLVQDVGHNSYFYESKRIMIEEVFAISFATKHAAIYEVSYSAPESTDKKENNEDINDSNKNSNKNMNLSTDVVANPPASAKPILRRIK